MFKQMLKVFYFLVISVFRLLRRTMMGFKKKILQSILLFCFATNAMAWLNTPEHELAKKFMQDPRLQLAYEKSANPDMWAKCFVASSIVIIESKSSATQDTKLLWLMTFEGLLYSRRILENKLKISKSQLDDIRDKYFSLVKNNPKNVDVIVRECRDINQKIHFSSGIF